MRITDELIQAMNNFNTKYHCNFSFEEFDKRFRRRPALYSSNEEWASNYKHHFKSAYKEALTRIAEFSEERLDCEDMLDDFQRDIVDPYIREAENQGTSIKHPEYAGMGRSERLEMLRDTAPEAPLNFTGLYTHKYLTGKIRIRDMRANANAVLTNPDSTREDILRIAACANALEEVSITRPRWWRILHPVRNNAEKRDSQALRRLVTAKAKEMGTSYGNLVYEAGNPTQGITEALKAVNDNLIDLAIQNEIDNDNSILDGEEVDNKRNSISVNDIDMGLENQSNQIIEPQIQPSVIKNPSIDEKNL